MAKSKPPVDLLWEKYSYNPLTGRFHRKIDDTEMAGNIVGANGRSHQLSINYDHRYPYGVCVFAWINGRWPKDGLQIDHIDSDPFNHCAWNLQEITRSENLAKRRRVGARPFSYYGNSTPVLGSSLLPEHLQKALLKSSEKISLLRSRKYVTNNYREPKDLIKCDDSQKSAIQQLGWNVPKVGEKVFASKVHSTRARFGVTTNFYTTLLFAIQDSPIHFGDIAKLWLATVSPKVNIPQPSAIFLNLSRISGHSVTRKDELLFLGEKLAI